jgi:hypothetical protein
MRTLTIGVPVLLATVFAAGCSDRNAPVELSGDPGFDRAPVVTTFEIEPFAFDNPCIPGTGLDDVVRGTQTVREHFFETETDPPRHHINVGVRSEIETDAGFSGFDRSRFTDMGIPAPGVPEEEFTSTFTLTVNLSNDSGQRVIGHVISHLTRMRDQTTGELVNRAEVFKVSFKCV